MQHYQAYGVRVIVDRFVAAVGNAQISHKLDSIPSISTVVPYGVLESYELIKASRFRLNLSLLVDAYSLGQISHLKAFALKNYIPFPYKILSFLRFVKYFYYEFRILQSYKNIMLVSCGDKKFYENILLTRKYTNKIIVVPNGVEKSKLIKCNFKKETPNITIGCLCSWTGDGVYYSMKLFLETIWNKTPKTNIRLLISGRGMSEEMRNYFLEFQNVEILGEVRDLSEFYSQIDASLIVMKKKCGIINRVLDAFSFGVPVLCTPENLLAFRNASDCCFSFSDYHTFLTCINNLKNNKEEISNKVRNAFNLLERDHNWDKNYSIFSQLMPRSS